MKKSTRKIVEDFGRRYTIFDKSTSPGVHPRMDRIDQGSETCTLSEAAAGLKESDVWYFWWD